MMIRFQLLLTNLHIVEYTIKHSFCKLRDKFKILGEKEGSIKCKNIVYCYEIHLFHEPTYHYDRHWVVLMLLGLTILEMSCLTFQNGIF